MTIFKAKLIEKTAFYRSRRNNLLLSLVPTTAIIMGMVMVKIAVWFIIAGAILLLAIFILQFKSLKIIKNNSEQSKIEMNISEIRIISTKSLATTVINMEEVDKITVKEDYSQYNESISLYKKEIKGEYHKNFILIEHGEKRQQFDFIIETDYMIKQLKKVITEWEQKGYELEWV